MSRILSLFIAALAAATPARAEVDNLKIVADASPDSRARPGIGSLHRIWIIGRIAAFPSPEMTASMCQ